MMRAILFALLVAVVASSRTHSRIANLKRNVMRAKGPCGCEGCIPCTHPRQWAELKDERPRYEEPPTAPVPQAHNLEMPKIDFAHGGFHKVESVYADDNSKGVISCKKGFKNCHRDPLDFRSLTPAQLKTLTAAQLQHLQDTLPAGHPCSGGITASCLGVLAGPFPRSGANNHMPFPVPYKMPDGPFPPDTQDWTRPSMIHAREEGENEEKPDQAPLIPADVGEAKVY